jgi:hypothetical protein
MASLPFLGRKGQTRHVKTVPNCIMESEQMDDIGYVKENTKKAIHSVDWKKWGRGTAPRKV